MPEIKETVRVTRRGEDLPDLRDGAELQTNAWLLYEAAKTEAGKPGADARPYEYQDAPGIRWTGSVNSLMTELWVSLSNDPDDLKSREFKRSLNAYLNATNNLVCIARSANRYTWFIRGEWNPDAPLPRAAVSQSGARVPAGKFSVGKPHEPEPAEGSEVKVSFKCTWEEGCPHIFPTEASRRAHHFSSHRSAQSYVAEALAGSAPVTVENLQLRLEGMGYPGTADTTRNTLKAMQGAALAHSQGQGDEETWALGAATRGKLPSKKPEVQVARTLPDIPQQKAARPGPVASEDGFRCREPGCTEPPFKEPHQRSRHEKSAHRDTSSRKYPCTYPKCTERFYDEAPLSIHAARTHGILRDSPEGKALLQAAIDSAEGKVFPEAPGGPQPVVPERQAAVLIAERPAPTPAPAQAAPTPTTQAPLRESVDALDAVAALVEEVRTLRAKGSEVADLRAENEALRAEREALHGRLSKMRKMLEDE